MRTEHLYTWYNTWNETDTDQVAANNDNIIIMQVSDVFVCLELQAGK